MRLSPEIARWLKTRIVAILPDAQVYLFGSRANNARKGGDIDILVVGSRPLTGQEKRDVKIGFQVRFGEQKLDLVSFGREDPSAFRQMAQQEGILL